MIYFRVERVGMRLSSPPRPPLPVEGRSVPPPTVPQVGRHPCLNAALPGSLGQAPNWGAPPPSRIHQRPEPYQGIPAGLQEATPVLSALDTPAGLYICSPSPHLPNCYFLFRPQPNVPSFRSALPHAPAALRATAAQGAAVHHSLLLAGRCHKTVTPRAEAGLASSPRLRPQLLPGP